MIKGVRNIKEKKKSQNKKENTINQQRENNWDNRFIFGNIKEINRINQNKTNFQIPKPKKHTLESNINSIQSQLKSMRRTHNNSGTNYNYQNNNNNNIEDELNSQSTQNDDFSYIRNYNAEEIDIVINNLWDNLGVLDEYKLIFNETIDSINNNNSKNELYYLEIENLKKFEESLIKFGKNIENREKSLLLLKKLNQVIETQFINFNLDIPDNIIKDFIQTIQVIRMNSINVVLSINSIREMCSYSTINGKYDLDKIKKYNFDRNYLVKMRYSLDFLCKSSINNYKGFNFNFNDEGDPFLISVNNVIPISLEQSNKIRQCQYIIMQDSIFGKIYQLKQKKETIEKKIVNSNNLMNNKIQKKNTKIVIDDNIKDDSKLDDSNLSHLKKKLEPIKSNKESRKDIKIEKEKIESIQKEEIIKDDFDKFNKNNKNYNYDYLNDGFVENGNYDDDDEDFDNEIEMNKKEIARIKKEEEERKKKEKNNELNELRKLQKEKIEEEKRKIEEEKRKKEIEEMRKKEIDELNKKKKEEEKIIKKKEVEIDKIKEDINLKKENTVIEIQKLKEDLNPISKEEKKEKEIQKIKDFINKKKEEEKKQEIEKEKEKEKTSPKQIKKIKIKTDKNIIQNDKNNKEKNEEEDGMNELKNSILNSSRLNKHSRPTSVISRRSLTPETQAKKLCDICNFSFFTGQIKDFITAYNHYFKSIPEIQKSVFNCKLNIIESINLFYTPKIIICTDKKNNFLIKGICIFGFEFENNIIKVIISHISSYNDIERDNIISFLMLFIKQHIECDEIIIDLYYQYNEETNKFNLDNEIRDLFKNNLMFKWVKLENVDNKTRFQKMSLKIDKDEILETVGKNNITMQKLKPQKLFEINDNIIFSIKENEKNDDSVVNYDKFVNMFSVVFLYNKLKKDSFSFSNFEDKYKDIFENEIKFEEMDINNIINFKMNEKDIESFYIKNNLSSNNLMNVSLNIHINPIFNSSVSTIINNYNYNRIENNEISILLDNNSGMKFYLIPTKDGNSIIITEINNENNKYFINNNVNIYDIFRDFYQNLSEEKKENTSNVIYIPSFNMETKIICSELNCFKDLKMIKNNKNFKICNIEEDIKIKFNYDSNQELGFKINQPEKNDIIIKDNFLIAIVNIDILTNLSIPSILLFYITKENWITNK